MTIRLAVLDAGGTPVLEVGPGQVHRLDGEDVATIGSTLRGDGPTGWRVAIDGRVVRGGAVPAVLATRGLVTVGPAPVAPDVSVADHLLAIDRDADGLLDDAPLLAGRGSDPAGVLSGGERRVLAWLRAVALRPRAVYLDRAGEGLDRDTLAWAGRRVAAWLEDGVAVVLHAEREAEHRWADPAARGVSPRD